MSEWLVLVVGGYNDKSEIVEAASAEQAVERSRFDCLDRPVSVWPVAARALLLHDEEVKAL